MRELTSNGVRPGGDCYNYIPLCAVGDILFANGSTQVIRLVLWLSPSLG